MPHQQVEKRKTGYYGVIGDVTFESVTHVEQEGFAAIDESPGQVLFDFASVGQCSSASLALLLSWLRHAQAQQKVLKITHASNRLAGQLKSAGLDHLIPLE